jgi:hypothetical protein
MFDNTGRFIVLSVITNIYNKKTKGHTLMELFTATGRLKKFLQLEMFDVYTRVDMTHINVISKFLPHTRQHGCIEILHCCNDPCWYVPLLPHDLADLKARIIAAAKNINICNHGEHYETPCIMAIGTINYTEFITQSTG